MHLLFVVSKLDLFISTNNSTELSKADVDVFFSVYELLFVVRDF